jgi:hypothetical protein
MEAISGLIWITAIVVYVLFIGLFIFLWLQFRSIRKNFWENRHIEVKEPIKPIDLTPRYRGPRIKPKFRTEAQLFEIEQNPAKR